MSIAGKHLYRFVYLRSEKWDNVRLEALVRDGAACKICGEVDVSNDAHHLYYPESFWDTTPEHLVILCRPCHEFAHAIMDKVSKSKTAGFARWNSLVMSIRAWRISKMAWAQGPVCSYELLSPKDLRTAYAALKERCIALENKFGPIAPTTPEPTPTRKKQKVLKLPISGTMCFCCKSDNESVEPLSVYRTIVWRLCMDCRNAITAHTDMKSIRKEFETRALTLRKNQVRVAIDGAGTASN